MSYERRESKDCYFSATRRKRRTEGNDTNLDEAEEEYLIRNGRKRSRMSIENDVSQPELPLQQSLSPGVSTVSGTAGIRTSEEASASLASPQRRFSTSLGRAQIITSSIESVPAGGTGEAQHLTNSTAAALLNTEVYNGHDALNLLFEAAGQSGDIESNAVGSQAGALQSPSNMGVTPGSHVSTDSGRANGGLEALDEARMMPPPLMGPTSNILPLPNVAAPAEAENPDARDLQIALRAWSKFRFIRAGWLTAREAIAFYTYLAPLTPISPPNFESPATHPTLLADEPILTVTLLTLASRYMILSGPGGVSRSYAIHEKLWTYLRGMIQRMLWGQEQFGGFGGSDDAESQTSSTAPWRGLRKGSLRTLGTVESLMLLTEWHPRALHFPPGDDGEELIIKDDRPDIEGLDIPPIDSDAANTDKSSRRIERWLEPAWRSDRMCWMLLGNALSLSFELGVFDDIDGVQPLGAEMYRPEYDSISYRTRARHDQKLLLIYVTQLAGRLGWTNMVPHHIAKLTFSKPAGQIFDEMKNTTFSEALNGAEQRRLERKNSLTLGESPQETVIYCWMEIATLMKSGNELLFCSRAHTREIIRTGRYVILLEHFRPLLKRWREEFDKLNVPEYMRHILSIEYHYIRVYCNSLALQAVVERCTNNAGNSALTMANAPSSPPDGATSNPRGFANVSQSTLMSLQSGDQEYIHEVVDASRSILKIVVEGLLPNDYLKHAPVRTYFRITFAIGAKEDDVAISLGLIDLAVHALRTCVVDDVHLGIRFADLLETLTKRIRSRFVRMAATSNSGGGPTGGTRSPHPRAPTPQAQTPNLAPWGMASYESGTNPLLGISTESIDPGGSVSIMPPPSFYLTPSAYEGLDAPGGTFLEEGGYIPDWLALPLDPLLNSYGGGVGQTEVGVDVNGVDLLDILLNEMEEGNVI
ncbi:MAG: hypothetical protein M1829_004268 [Trizodia sp. TS-e1964]|nr:MAG: hypothetical protein M1829_004268 [Trizodia sp. TS-e1964]